MRARVRRPGDPPGEDRGWRRERPRQLPRVPALGPTPPRLPRRAVHTPARSSRPLGDPRRAAPPRGRCSPRPGGRRQAASPLKTASAAPRRRRRRRRSLRPAALRCARLALRPPLRFPHPPGTVSRRRTSASTGSAADPNDFGANASGISGVSEASARRRPTRARAPGRARPCAVASAARAALERRTGAQSAREPSLGAAMQITSCGSSEARDAPAEV